MIEAMVADDAHVTVVQYSWDKPSHKLHIYK